MPSEDELEVNPEQGDSETDETPEPQVEPIPIAELPRAEDFDSGDTEILSQAMGMEPRTRRWLPWKKKG